ncbi:hypothetical protein JCM10550A_19970 [Methanogenium cariaci]
MHARTDTSWRHDAVWICACILLFVSVTAGTAYAADVSACPPTNQFLVCGDQMPSPGYVPSDITAADYETMYGPVNVSSADMTASTDFYSYMDSGSLDTDDWEQFAKNEKNNGFTTSKGPDTNSISWISNISAIGAPSMVISNGVLYAYRGSTGFDGNAKTFLYALDEYSGDDIWNVSIPSPEWGSWSSPAYHNGSVYTSTGKDTWKINAADGTVDWKFVNPSGHASCNGGPTIADGKVFCGDWDGNHYYCVHEDNGVLNWTFTVTGYVQGTPAYEDGLVYLTSWSDGDAVKGHMYCVNATDGTQIWHNNKIAQNCCGSPSIGDDKIYVTTYNFYGYGELLALSKETGDILWQKSIERTDSTPILAYGNVYLTGGCSGYSDHRTYCFNAQTGDLIWQTDTADDIGGWTCTVAVADGKVYVGGESATNYFNYDRTFALDAYTGETIWWYPQGGATPIVHDGRVFTVGNDGRIYCFGPARPVAPEGNFCAVPTSGIVPFTVDFTDMSTGEPTSWEWDFDGDGNIDSTEQNPSWTYTQAGTYPVSLSVENPIGTDTCTQADFIRAKAKAVWYVDDDGAEYPDRDYATIAEAVTAACEGGTVQVYSGTYNERPTLNKTLTLQGIGSPVIDAESFADEDAVTVESDACVIRGFAITHAGVSRSGIHVTAKDCVIEDVTITGCSGGIWLDDGSTGAAIYRNTITGCTGTAAIYDTCGGNHIYQNDLIGNSAGNVHAPGVSDTWHSPAMVTYQYGDGIYTSYLGNHWDDYASVDGNADGIGDSAYEGIDEYPLVASFTQYHTAVPEDDWSQFQRTNRNNGVTASQGPVEEPGQLWKEMASGTGINAPPLCVGDMVYVISSNGNVTAFDRIYGTTSWESETYSGSIQTATPAYGNGKIFAATFNGYLFAFDAETGEELWQRHVTDNNLQGPVSYADHRIYVGDGNFGGPMTRDYHCYDEYGNELWCHATDNTCGFQWCGAAFAGDYVIYPTSEGTLVSLNAKTGAPAGELDLTTARADISQISASAVYSGSSVYITTKAGETGYVFKVEYNEETGAFTGVTWDVATHEASSSTPVITGGRVYFGEGTDGTTGHLTCLDDATGSEIWSYEVENGVKCSPAVSVQGDKAYIYFTEALNDGYLYCVDDTGTLLWIYNPHSDTGYVSRGVAVSDGRLFLGTDAGYLHCLATGPSADFSADVTEGTMPLTVHFTDLSTGNPTSYLWDFGDGATSTEREPSHTYTREGDFTVRLTATNSVDGRTETKYHYISLHETGLFLEPSDTGVKIGLTKDYTIKLSSAPDGLMRYNIIVALERPELAEIVNVSIPEWISTQETSGVPSDSVSLVGYDGDGTVVAGAENIVLGTFTVRGDVAGSTGISVGINPFGGYLTNDCGMNFIPYCVDSTLNVSQMGEILPFPDMAVMPKDLNGDGIYEDINANDEVDYADVSLYYQNRAWIVENQDISAFDFSGNGEIDLADVALLFGKMGMTA